MALGAASIWSINFALIRYLRIDEALDPVPMYLLRYDTAAIVAGLLVLWRRPRLAGLGWRGWLLLVGLSVLIGPVYQVMLASGAKTTSSGIIGMLIGSQPIHIAWLGALILGERVRRAQWLAIGLAYVGVSLPLALGEQLDLKAGLTGPALVFAGSVLAGLNGVVPRRMRHAISPRDLVLVTLLLAVLLSLPLTSRQAFVQWSNLSALGWVSMLHLALPGLLGAMALWYGALWRLRAATAAYYMLVMMAMATFWGWVIHHEPLTVWHLVALACVGTGLIINTRAGRHPKQDERAIVE